MVLQKECSHANNAGLNWHTKQLKSRLNCGRQFLLKFGLRSG
jgi:hypothetical protein